MLRKGFEVVETDDGSTVLRTLVENIWNRVKRWARRHGREYVPSYGIVGVAPL